MWGYDDVMMWGLPLKKVVLPFQMVVPLYFLTNQVFTHTTSDKFYKKCP